MAYDPDTPEWTEEEITRAKPGAEVLPADFVATLGPGAVGAGSFARKQVTIFLDTDVIDYLKSDGPDWNERLNDTLRKAVGL